MIRFDTYSDSLAKLLESVQEFTLAPGFYFIEKKGNTSTSLEYIGSAEINPDDDLTQDADMVHAPYYKVSPIIFECKLHKREKESYINHFEASVVKTHISEAAKDENGNIDMKKAGGLMIWKASLDS